MNYGRTFNGFKLKPFSVLIEQFYSRMSSFLGGPVDTNPDGPLGQIGRAGSIPHATVWEMMEGLSLALNPDSADGADLTRAVAYQGLTAKPATTTVVDAILEGTEGTVVPTGSQISQQVSNYIFESTEDVTITKDSVIRYALQVPGTVTTGDTVSVRITPQFLPPYDLTYTLTGAETPGGVAIELATLLNVNNVATDTGTAEIDPEDATIVIVNTYSPFRSVGLSLETNLTIPQIWTLGEFRATVAGPIIVIPDTATIIQTGTPGWNSVTNHVTGQAGADAETSVALRARRTRGFQVAGGATPLAIEGKIFENVRNTTLVRVFENPKDTVDRWGRPPHSINVVVENGDADDIAQQIFESAAAGIPTVGSVSKNIVDAGGNTRVIKFDRPLSLFGHVRVNIEEKNTEEPYPPNAEELIRNAIFQTAVNGIGLGSDVVAQKFVGSAYRAVTGLKKISIDVAVTGLPTNDPSIPVGNPEDSNMDSYSSGWQPVIVEVAPKNKVEWRDSIPRIIINDQTI